MEIRCLSGTGRGVFPPCPGPCYPALPDKWYGDAAGEETITYNFGNIPGYSHALPVALALAAGTYRGINGLQLAPVIFIPGSSQSALLLQIPYFTCATASSTTCGKFGAEL